MGWFKRRSIIKTRHRRHAKGWAREVIQLLREMPDNDRDRIIWATNLIKAQGYRLVERKGHTKHQRRFTVTWRRKIALVDNFYNLPLGKQARILIHELIHVLFQRLRNGHWWFEWRYLSAPWRWAIETPAYVANLLVYRAQGKSDAWLRKWIPGKLGRYYDGYAMGRIPRDQFDRETREIWSVVFSAIPD